MGLAIFIIGVFNFFLSGFVFMEVWNWFAHPILNAPYLHFAGALGLLMVIHFFKTFPRTDSKPAGAEKELGRAIAITIVYLILFGISYLISLFI